MDPPSQASYRRLSVSSEYRAEIQPYYDDHRSSFGGLMIGGSTGGYQDNRLPPLGLQEPPPNYHHSQDHRNWNHNRDQGELGRYHNSSFRGREDSFHPSDVRFANDTYRFRHDGYQPYSEYHRRPSDVPCRGCGRINCTCTRLPPNPSYRHDDYHHSNGYG